LRRRPNPWILVPSLVAGLVAGWLGGTVTSVSCRYQELDGTLVTCPGWTTVVSVFSFIVVGLGVAVVLVLVYRSIAEWREHQDGDRTA
jgi:hypothetical protein